MVWQEVSDPSLGEQRGIKLELDVLMWSHHFQYTYTGHMLMCVYIDIPSLCPWRVPRGATPSINQHTQHPDLSFSTLSTKKEAEIFGEMTDSRLRQRKYESGISILCQKAKMFSKNKGISKRSRTQLERVLTVKSGAV